MGRLVQVNRPGISGKRRLYNYTVVCVPTSQLKPQPLNGRAYVRMTLRCECWRAPTGLLILSVHAYSRNHHSIDSQSRLTCQRVNFVRGKPGGFVSMSRGGSISLSVKDRCRMPAAQFARRCPLLPPLHCLSGSSEKRRAGDGSRIPDKAGLGVLVDAKLDMLPARCLLVDL